MADIPRVHDGAAVGRARVPCRRVHPATATRPRPAPAPRQGRDRGRGQLLDPDHARRPRRVLLFAARACHRAPAARAPTFGEDDIEDVTVGEHAGRVFDKEEDAARGAEGVSEQARAPGRDEDGRGCDFGEDDHHAARAPAAHDPRDKVRRAARV